MRRPCANDTVESLRHSLRALNLSTSGKKDTLLKRARKAYSSLESEGQLAPVASPSTSSSEGSAAAAVTSLPARGYPGKYKAFLLFDAEGTCESGTKDYDYPNEIIEFPVVLLKWRVLPKPGNPFSQELYVASSYQSFVRPTFRPQLSAFCTTLTGITQATVDAAPEFPDVLADFERWLTRHDLSTTAKGEEKDWLWVTDGPWDLRDFVTKQLYISRLKPALYPYLSGPVLDLKTALNDRWRADLIRTTPEPTVDFPLTEPSLSDPLSTSTSDGDLDVRQSEDKSALAEGQSPNALPPSAKSKPSPTAPSTTSPPRSPPSIRPPPLQSSYERSRSPQRCRSTTGPSSPPFLPSALPPIRRASQSSISRPTSPAIVDLETTASLLPSPLRRALGLERPPQRTVGRVNRHLKDAFRRDDVHRGRYLTIEGMIRRLNMGTFEGPAHSGIVDAFNMARVVIRLSQLPPALRTQLLEPNMNVQQGTKVFAWMTRGGEIDLSAITRGSLADAKGVVKPAGVTNTAAGSTAIKSVDSPTPAKREATTADCSAPTHVPQTSEEEPTQADDSADAVKEAGVQLEGSPADEPRDESRQSSSLWSWLQGRSGG